MAVQRRVVVIAYTDGTIDRFPLTPKIQVYFERTYKIGLDQLNSGGQVATNLYKLAYEVAKANANGSVIADVSTWLEGVDVVEIELEDVVPLADTASAATSLGSASPQE